VGGGKDHPYMSHAAVLSSFSVLDQEEIGVKFNKSIMIKGKMNEYK
jgi:hypothetical protein